ncbi:MAG: hypothetical protein R3266_08785, partial [Gemmatimonadota bacterium]|nr:hypothetical protein [Gemmatimonadota bacterium]
DAGRPLIGEILLAIAAEYAWPEPRPREVRALTLDAESAREYAGRFRMSAAPDVSLTIRWRRGRLEARAGDGPPTELVRVAGDRFVRMSDGRTIRFERDRSGGIAAVVAEGGRARRVAPP